ncbi:unnamed protein product [Allacma fusca]|uniref:Ig-like domain-containing protein n=1 Tax=Allacma fusca TaxID=39272 RepID=A0A8J2J666_9HEXA|nr:unnamed protein product [Allacma fusca]
MGGRFTGSRSQGLKPKGWGCLATAQFQRSFLLNPLPLGNPHRRSSHQVSTQPSTQKPNLPDVISRRYHSHGLTSVHSGFRTISASNYHAHHSPKVRNHGESPKIGAVLKNFKGDTLRVLTDSAHSYVVLPKLDVEDYVWEGFSIQLTCIFHQPVQWIYKGDGAPLVKTETHRFAPDVFNASTFLFGAKVIFTHTNYKQTGQYSCQSIHEPSTLTSLFVFVPGKRIFVRDDKEGSLHSNSTDESLSTLIIHGDALSKRIKLPCSVSSPNVSVQLYKEGKLVEQSGKRIFYRPENGFEIFRETFNNPWGRYECVEEQSQQRLIIQVELPKYALPVSSLKDPEKNKISTYSENSFGHSVKHVHLKFHYDKRRNALACCAFDGQGKRLSQYPVLKYASCDSVSECKILQKRLEQTNCSVKRVCESKRMKQHCVGYELSEFDDQGLMECSVGDEAREFFQFSKIGDTVITDFSELPPTDEILEIVTEDSSTPGKTTFTCIANSFFFSHGLKWGFQNDSEDLLISDEKHPAKISIEFSPDEASKVYCFAPVWNSGEWRNVSVLHPQSF